VCLAARVRSFVGGSLGRDCRNCQTFPASPAEPGELPWLLDLFSVADPPLPTRKSQPHGGIKNECTVPQAGKMPAFGGYAGLLRWFSGAGRPLVLRLTRLAHRDATCEQTVRSKHRRTAALGKAAVAADTVCRLRLGQSATEIHVCGNGSISAHSETSWKYRLYRSNKLASTLEYQTTSANPKLS
jgi:hypothetical protein